VGAAERIEAVPAHTGPVWSLAALPDSSGAQQALRFCCDCTCVVLVVNSSSAYGSPHVSTVGHCMHASPMQPAVYSYKACRTTCHV
jgi:hypothetical protein